MLPRGFLHPHGGEPLGPVAQIQAVKKVDKRIRPTVWPLKEARVRCTLASAHSLSLV